MRAFLIIFILLSVGWFALSMAGAADQKPVTATTQADGSMVIVLSPEKVKTCGEQGGCSVLSVDELVHFVQRIKPQLCSQREAYL